MEKYITMEEACSITRLCNRTLKRHIYAGRLKCSKPAHSNMIRFTRKQIKDFMKGGSSSKRKSRGKIEADPSISMDLGQPGKVTHDKTTK